MHLPVGHRLWSVDMIAQAKTGLGTGIVKAIAPFVLFATASEKTHVGTHLGTQHRLWSGSRNSAQTMVRGSSQEAFWLCWSWVPSFSSHLRFSRPERHQHGIACGPGKHLPVTSGAKECERAGRRNRHRPGLSLSALRSRRTARCVARARGPNKCTLRMALCVR